MPTCTATTRLTMSPFDRDKPPIACMRPVNPEGRHVGEHQGIEHVAATLGDPDSPFQSLREDRGAWDRLVTWDTGGARSHRYHPDEPNLNCSCHKGSTRTGHRPEDHHWADCEGCGIIFDSTSEARCSTCVYWQIRLDGYNETSVAKKGARFVRAHGDSLASEPWLYVWSPGHGGAFGGRQFVVTWDDGTTVGPADFLWANGRIPWWLVDRFPPNATVTSGEKINRPGHTTGFNGAGSPLTFTGHPGNL